MFVLDYKEGNIISICLSILRDHPQSNTVRVSVRPVTRLVAMFVCVCPSCASAAALSKLLPVASWSNEISNEVRQWEKEEAQIMITHRAWWWLTWKSPLHSWSLSPANFPASLHCHFTISLCQDYIHRCVISRCWLHSDLWPLMTTVEKKCGQCHMNG